MYLYFRRKIISEYKLQHEMLLTCFLIASMLAKLFSKSSKPIQLLVIQMSGVNLLVPSPRPTYPEEVCLVIEHLPTLLQHLSRDNIWIEKLVSDPDSVIDTGEGKFNRVLVTPKQAA
eukprot:GFUD01023860.1.p1 GENE.GFUD01023860.1~~GFUD01023860.1.p1  ORF type:complete len:117 (+),score=9.62 GFUD01023860.1:1-351(+)